MTKIDIDALKQAASSRWPEILNRVGGIPIESLDGNHHECSKCGGVDRFRLINEAAGAVFCNQCFSTKNGDGIAAVQWAADIDFKEATRRIAEHLGIDVAAHKTNGKKATRTKKKGPGKDLEWQPWSSALVAHWLAKKPGVTEAALLAAGAKLAKYKRMTVIAFPVVGQKLDASSPTGWAVVNCIGEFVPTWDREGNVTGQKKIKVLYGSKAGLFGVHATDRLNTEGLAELVWKVEGLTDLLALWSIIPEQLRDRHLVVSTANGAQENPRWQASLLSNYPTNVIHDADESGWAGAKKWSQSIASQSLKECRNVQLPYAISKTKGKDLRNLIVEGHSYADLLALADEVDPIVAAEAVAAEDELPEVALPGGDITVTQSAWRLGGLLSQQKKHYVRGGGVVTVDLGDRNERPTLRTVKPSRLASDFEKVAQLQKIKTGDEGDVSFVATVCSEANARLILNSCEFNDALPEIKVVSSCPLLVEQDGNLVVVNEYHEGSAILAGGPAAEDVSLQQSCKLLRQAIADYKFASESDRSRALAAMITPALVLGKLLPGRAPIDLGEADASQTGKGYRNKITAAIYRHSPRVVNQRRGFGSLEESFDQALISGATFVAIDNVRGNVDSPSIESFLTENNYSARAAFSPVVEIDPRRVNVMFTSNKADITRDLANRCSCVRILKREDGFQYAAYSEGDVLSHIECNQPLFLGAVFSIIRAWHEAGKPRTTETRHDFRGWAQSLDWIVQNLLGAAPLMDGHRETQVRMTNPAMNWLRDVAQAVVKSVRSGEWLRASGVLDIIEDTDVEVPGLKDGSSLEDDSTRTSVLTAMGRKFKKCFGDCRSLDIDLLRIERIETRDEGSRQRFDYHFSEISDPREGEAENGTLRGKTDAKNGESQTETESPAKGSKSPAKAPRQSREETPIPRDSRDTHQLVVSKSDNPESVSSKYETMCNVAGVAGNRRGDENREELIL